MLRDFMRDMAEFYLVALALFSSLLAIVGLAFAFGMFVEASRENPILLVLAIVPAGLLSVSAYGVFWWSRR